MRSQWMTVATVGVVLGAIPAGVLWAGCTPGATAPPATASRSLERCRAELGRQRSQVRQLRSRLAQLDGALRRAMELSAGASGRSVRRLEQLRAELGRLRWFRRAACQQVDVRLAEAEFHARMKELAYERLQKDLARARSARHQRKLKPRVAEALALRARWRHRRAALRELRRRCQLDAAGRALRTSPPPPPAPGAKER